MATDPEVLAVERLHQAAQARLGVAAAVIALAEWQSVSATAAAATAAPWLTTSLRTILAIQKMSLKLAVAYYMLVRALETGRVLGTPEGSSTKDVTLGELRSNFRNIALDVAALPSSRTRSDDPDIRWFEDTLRERQSDEATETRSIRLDDAEVDPLIQDLLDVEGPNDADTVSIDRYEWPEEPTLEDVDEAYRDLLREEAVKFQIDKVKALRIAPDLNPDQVIGQIEKAHETAGSIGSGNVEAAGIQPGRDAINEAAQRDRLVLAVARGTSSDPCAFCAMLASRGFVYKNASTAGVGDAAEIKKYHIHCKCFPIVRYVKASELPALNDYFQRQWPVVTAGYSGVDALNAWRRWIYKQRKANPNAPHGQRTNQTT